MKKNESTFLTSDLVWYFNGSPADCGFKSNFGAFIYFMLRGTAPSGSECFDPEAKIDDHVIHSAGRHRRIRNRLTQCGKAYFTLETHFTYSRQHLQIQHVFENYSNLITKKYGQEVLLKMIKSDYNKCKKIKQQAQEELEQCIKIYQQTF